MTTRVITSNKTQAEQELQAPAPRWQMLLTVGIILALVIIAILMRLYNLDKPFDYDGYDEGVYWQSLRAMSAGYALYGQIFYSQPPFFLLSVYPFFALLGKSIWAARVGIACLSLLGLPGAYLMGKALGGRVGGIAAMTLLVFMPLYLAESQILQAEAPATALSFLAVGAALMWWKYPAGRNGMIMAIVCGITLPLGILMKLLNVTDLVPVGLLVLARLWLMRRQAPAERARVLPPIIAAVAVCIAVTLIVLAPFLGSFQPLMQQVVTYHNVARTALIADESKNASTLGQFLLSNIVLVLAAAFGAAMALLRRDWRAVPLIAWFVVTFAVLWVQVPLFPRHAIALLPSLIALSVIGLRAMPSLNELRTRIPTAKLAAPLAAFLLLIVVVSGLSFDYAHYRTLSAQAASPSTQLDTRIARDLLQATTPDQQVITDGQFVAGLANRSVPPWLVDTSMVRIQSGYLTLQQLIQAASDPHVHAVLFISGRFSYAQVAGFHAWVAQHFRFLHAYHKDDIELWVR